MNPSRIVIIAGALLGASLLLREGLARPEPGALPTRVVSTDRLSQSVTIRDVRVVGGDVSGVLVNSSGKVVRDVELLIRHDWLWNDEFRPGADGPSRAVYFTVPGEFAPGGHTPFAYHADPPLPVHSGGQFHTSVEVAGLVEIGESPTAEAVPHTD
jgi:hypothetical protein